MSDLLPRPYTINVRAMVRVIDVAEGGGNLVGGSPWEMYDTEKVPSGWLLRLDTLVQVSATAPEAAVLAAKDAAPLIEIEGAAVDVVELWVDEEIDINPLIFPFAVDPGERSCPGG